MGEKGAVQLEIDFSGIAQEMIEAAYLRCRMPDGVTLEADTVSLPQDGPLVVAVLYDGSSVGFGCDQYAIVRIQNGQSQATFTHTDGSFTLTLGNAIISSRTYTWYAYGM